MPCPVGENALSSENSNSIVSDLLKDVKIPRMFKVKQILSGERIELKKIPAQICSLLNEERFAGKIKPGMKIAITAGSRGIANIALITKTLVEFVKSKGATPLIVAAMGSHGGAIAEGQRKILSNFGITEETMGCSVMANMDVVKIGVNDEGAAVFMAKDAALADGIIVSCRIKPHTCFRGPYESGIMKMLAIGLGKQIGADTCHQAGFQNMAKNVPLYGRAVLKNAPILLAVAVLENAFDETAKIVALERDEIERKEPALLEEAKALLPRIFVPKCDVLICDTIGKNFSGSGMDANITGTFVTPYCSGGLKSQRVAVLDLSRESHHNATGCGMAHATTRRFFDKMDFEMTYPNVITSTVIENVRIPMVLKHDREAIQVCIKTCTDLDPRGIRIVRIANSAEVEHIQLSEVYYDEVKESSKLVIESDPEEMPFDHQGNLMDLG